MKSIRLLTEAPAWTCCHACGVSLERKKKVVEVVLDADQPDPRFRILRLFDAACARSEGLLDSEAVAS